MTATRGVFAVCILVAVTWVAFEAGRRSVNRASSAELHALPGAAPPAPVLVGEMSHDQDTYRVLAPEASDSTDEMPEGSLDNRLGEPAVATEAVSSSAFKPFKDAAHYSLSPEHNPDGKTLTGKQLQELDLLISALNSEWRLLLMEEAQHAAVAAESKVAAGDYKPISVGESIRRDSHAQASHVVVSSDGSMKAVDLFAGESAEMDEIAQRKSAFHVDGKARIRQWIASQP